MLIRYRRLFAVTAAGVLLAASFIVGCSTETSGADTTAQALPTPNKSFTAADIAKLKWLEGTWKGTGDIDKPFYERYKFEGTTLVVDSFADESLEKSDASRYELKDGRFSNTDTGPGYAASAITNDSISFVPVGGPKNSFVWTREAGGSWKAVLSWPARDDKPAMERTYKMEPYTAGPK